MKHLTRGMFAALSASALVAVAGCGKDSTSPVQNKNTMTAPEAMAVASSIVTEMSRAVNTRKNSTAALSNASAQALESFSSTCTKGGKITGNMNYTSSINTAGTGTVSGSVSATSEGCLVSAGTRDIAVGGQWTMDFSMPFNKFAQSGDFNWHAAGSFNWEGGNCNIDFTMKIPVGGPGVLTGTFCGVPLSSNR